MPSSVVKTDVKLLHFDGCLPSDDDPIISPSCLMLLELEDGEKRFAWADGEAAEAILTFGRIESAHPQTFSAHVVRPHGDRVLRVIACSFEGENAKEPEAWEIEEAQQLANELPAFFSSAILPDASSSPVIGGIPAVGSLAFVGPIFDLDGEGTPSDYRLFYVPTCSEQPCEWGVYSWNFDAQCFELSSVDGDPLLARQRARELHERLKQELEIGDD